MIYGIAIALFGLLAMFLGKKLKAWADKNQEKYQEQKRQKEAAKKEAEVNK